MTNRFDVLFRKDGLAKQSIAQIYVKTSPSDEIDGEKHIFVTTPCYSMSDIEFQITQLIKELETLKKKANKKFTEEIATLKEGRK